MKHLLLILLFVPLISFGQKRTVTDLGVEQIEYGEKTKFYERTGKTRLSFKDQYIPRYLVLRSIAQNMRTSIKLQKSIKLWVTFFGIMYILSLLGYILINITT